MQFVKIPKKVILKYNGNELKYYAAVAKRTRKNKLEAFPSNATLMKDTGIKSVATLATIKKNFSEHGWVDITYRQNQSNLYSIPRHNTKFTSIPISAMALNKNAFKLYCILLVLAGKSKTYKITQKKLKKISGIKDGRTFNYAMVEILNAGFGKAKKHKDYKRIDKFKINICPTNVIFETQNQNTNVIIETHSCNNRNPLMEKLKPTNVIFETKVDYIEVDVYEVDYVKYGGSEPQRNSGSKVSPGKPKKTKPEKNKLNKLKKEIFAAEPDSENNKDLEKQGDISFEEAKKIWENKPSDIDRKSLRKKMNCSLSAEEYKEFEKAKQKGFNGNAEIVEKYVNHELYMWDDKIENEGTLITRFQKEAFLNHPIFSRYSELNDTERQAELTFGKKTC
jgi:hypothetical protein